MPRDVEVVPDFAHILEHHSPVVVADWILMLEGVNDTDEGLVQLFEIGDGREFLVDILDQPLEEKQTASVGDLAQQVEDFLAEFQRIGRLWHASPPPCGSTCGCFCNPRCSCLRTRGLGERW